MRQDCKHFQSRTYPSGDTMRKCAMDLAPEAPWACPVDCAAYEARMADVGWRHGTLITPPTPPAPPGVGEDPSVARLLDEAEDIINQAGETIRLQVDEERRPPRKKWWPFGKRR
jgi:hypothetical protein